METPIKQDASSTPSPTSPTPHYQLKPDKLRSEGAASSQELPPHPIQSLSRMRSPPIRRRVTVATLPTNPDQIRDIQERYNFKSGKELTTRPPPCDVITCGDVTATPKISNIRPVSAPRQQSLPLIRTDQDVNSLVHCTPDPTQQEQSNLDLSLETNTLNPETSFDPEPSFETGRERAVDYPTERAVDCPQISERAVDCPGDFPALRKTVTTPSQGFDIVRSVDRREEEQWAVNPAILQPFRRRSKKEVKQDRCNTQ